MPISRLVVASLATLGLACALEPDQVLPPIAPQHPVAYVSQGLAHNDDIFLLSANAQSDVNLTQFTAYDSWPSWSPAGDKIVFESNRDEPLFTELYVLTLVGGNVFRLTVDTGFADAQPAWSPLGDRIAFVSNRDSVAYDIYLVTPNGTSLTRLTNDSTNDVQPAWSPDGTQIAFATDRDGPNGEIYVMDTLGGNQVNLTNHPANDLTPTWSPDGTKIAFGSSRDSTGFSVWVMNANGSSPVRVSPTSPPCELPSWTPDGLRIAFDCDGDIWVANADGTGLQRITRTTNQQRSEVMARWKPVP